jgi:dynactin-5
VIEAAAIGSSVVIGDNCVVCPRVIIKDCVWIDDFSVVPPDMVIPPFSRVSGCPAQIFMDTLPESAAVDFVQNSLELFSHTLHVVETIQHSTE